MNFYICNLCFLFHHMHFNIYIISFCNIILLYANRNVIYYLYISHNIIDLFYISQNLRLLFTFLFKDYFHNIFDIFNLFKNKSHCFLLAIYNFIILLYRFLLYHLYAYISLISFLPHIYTIIYFISISINHNHFCNFRLIY